MSKIYFTLTGTNHYFGKEFLKKGMKIRLEKEPDNEYDKEAIKVLYEGLGKIGYVANSSYTVLGDSKSAGRIYDKIGKKAKAKVVLVTDHGTICSISKKSLLDLIRCLILTETGNWRAGNVLHSFSSWTK